MVDETTDILEATREATRMGVIETLVEAYDVEPVEARKLVDQIAQDAHMATPRVLPRAFTEACVHALMSMTLDSLAEGATIEVEALEVEEDDGR